MSIKLRNYSKPRVDIYNETGWHRVLLSSLEKYEFSKCIFTEYFSEKDYEEFKLKIEQKRKELKARQANHRVDGYYIRARIRSKSKTPILCYDKAKVIACPQCKVKAGAVCVRIDGKGSRTHRARVIKWEKING